jgi:Flp pilus assembly protein TadD
MTGKAKSQLPVLHGLLIAVVCLAAYSNTFHVPFQFDDDYQIVVKPYVRDIRHFLEGSGPKWFSSDHGFRMRPVGYFTFALNYRLHDGNVAGYHAVNLGIHLLNALLVYALVLLTFRTPWFTRPRAEAGDPPVPEDDSRRTVALFSALLFAAHPLQTQAVTYVVQRLASLATLWFLLSLVAYVRSRLASLASPSRYAFLPWYLASLACAVLAMKTKEIAFTLPLAIALYECLFFEGRAGKRLLYLLPLLLTMAIIPAGFLGAGRPAGELLGDVSQATRVGTAMTRWEYLLTEFRVIVTYLRLLVFPAHQNLDYDYPVFRSFLDPPVFLSFLFLLAIFLLAIWLLLRSRNADSGGRRDLRLVSFGIFWFFLTLSVESSVIPIADVIFEHRVYLPSVGFFVAVTSFLFLLGRRLEGKRKGSERYLIAGLSAAVVLLSVLTYARNGVWGSEVTLWEDAAGKSPAKARPHNNLGNSYLKKGRLEEAMREFETAIRIQPDLPDSHNNLGIVYSTWTRFDEAIREYRTAIHLWPGYHEAYNNLGIAYKRQGRLEDAIREFRTAIDIQPDYAEAHYNLGNVYALQGRFEEAIREFQAAILLNPNHPNAAENLELAIRLKSGTRTK